MIHRYAILLLFISVCGKLLCCTSAIVSPSASKSGHLLLWKHRDTSHSNNYVDTVSCPADHNFDYIALFNSSDTDKREAWAGANRSGFAIFNTVAGNLPPNRKDFADREGLIMSMALSKCRNVDDFQHLLDSLPKTLGVKTNFGVADSFGNGAYFETSDYTWTRFDLPKDSSAVLVRSNFSCSSSSEGGYGYERYNVAQSILLPLASRSAIEPETFTECLSRDFIMQDGTDALGSESTVRDKNFIPRPTSASSVVIELTPQGPIMWSVLGYPPASSTIGATIDLVDSELKLDSASGMNRKAHEANKIKKLILVKGKINKERAREIAAKMKMISKSNYVEFRKKIAVD